jgi:23S rRNA (uracil1939-C5)-methyltransferase
MKKDTVISGLFVEKLVFGGSGLARLPDGKSVIISGGAVPESVVSVRVVRSKKNYVEAQLATIEKPSPHVRELPAHWQVYGGCRWLPIAYDRQLAYKSDQVREAFKPLGDKVTEEVFRSIVACERTEGYRNKVEFSYGKYISAKEGIHEDYRFGFHVPASYDRIIDCTYCVLADESVNEIFREIDLWSRASGLPTYDPHTQEGCLRHLVVRRSHYTGQTMIVMSLRTEDASWTPDREGSLADFFAGLSRRHPDVTSCYLLENNGKADIVNGEYRLLLGTETIVERLCGLSFRIRPQSFFQVNTLQAEKLYSIVREFAPERGGLCLDLYAGTSTIGSVLADRFDRVVSVEINAAACEDARENAELNDIKNLEVVCAPVEKYLQQYTDSGERADFLVVDPPRDGMHPDAIAPILSFRAASIVYVSCNPSTLARDLERLLATGEYRIAQAVPVDMFPHTHHIETVVKLERIS